MGIELTLNAGYDNNHGQQSESFKGVKRLASVVGSSDKQFALTPGLHSFMSATGGVGKTSWAKKRISSIPMRIIHFMEPDGMVGPSEVVCKDLAEVCSAVVEAWEEGLVPFVNSFSVMQFSIYPGFSTAEGGYSLGFTSMLSQLSLDLVLAGLPLIIVLNARRQSDSDEKFTRALNDVESSSSSVWWFMRNGSIRMKTRLDSVTFGAQSFKYSRRSWLDVEFDAAIADRTEDVSDDRLSDTQSRIWGINKANGR